MEADFVIVGGGVAGVSCVEELVELIGSGECGIGADIPPRVVLVCGRSGYIKVSISSEKLGQIAESFQVEERRADTHFSASQVAVVQENVVGWNHATRILKLSDSSTLRFGKLCITTGAHAKRTFDGPNVIRVRDLDSVAKLGANLPFCKRRVLLIGNGGIATELVFELCDVEELVWAFRHDTISATYFDEVAAKFFQPKLRGGRATEKCVKPEVKSDRYTVYSRSDNEAEMQVVPPNGGGDGKTIFEKLEDESGCALGPHWLAKLNQQQRHSGEGPERKVHVLPRTEIKRIESNQPCLQRLRHLFNDREFEERPWRQWVITGDGSTFGCDLVIDATGVVPNSELWRRDCSELKVADNRGIAVDDWLRTSADGVFAAGDVCTLLSAQEKPHWQQIRLWTQARQMGAFAARSMSVANILPDIAFDIFTHVTTFMGYKVVLLGDFAASKVRPPYKTHYRVGGRSVSNKSENQFIPEEEDEYVKVITKDSRVVGAVLIGETDLEETMENLILNGTNVAQIEDDLLNPEIDLEDYFD